MASGSIPTLKRALGLFTATFIVVGILVGSGVFKKIIPLAKSGLSETWILLAWALAGFITLIAALNLSALASLTEESGGVYEYFRIAFGNLFSFLFGWADFSIIGSASVAALGYIFAQTIHSFIPLPNPFQAWDAFCIAGFIFPFRDGGIKILTICTIMLLTFINILGVKGSGFLNTVFTTAKLLGILAIIILALLYFSPEPIAALNHQYVADRGIEGTAFFSTFLLVMLNILWAYDGWINISFITGELKNPRRNVGRAIIFGVSIAMGLYLLLNFAYMKVLSLPELARVGDQQIGAVVVAEKMMGAGAKSLINLLIMISVLGSLHAIILSHARVYFRMAQEHFFFPAAREIHPVHQTPYKSLLMLMGWSCFLCISGTFDMLSEMIVFTGFIFYGLLAVAVIKLKQQGKLNQKLPGYPYIQVILLLFSLALLANTLYAQPKQSILGLGFVLTGIPLYYYWKWKKSKKPTG